MMTKNNVAALFVVMAMTSSAGMSFAANNIQQTPVQPATAAPGMASQPVQTLDTPQANPMVQEQMAPAAPQVQQPASAEQTETKEAWKQTGRDAKKAVKETGSDVKAGSEGLIDKSRNGASRVGKGIKTGAENVGGAVTTGAKKVGQGTKEGAMKVRNFVRGDRQQQPEQTVSPAVTPDGASNTAPVESNTAAPSSTAPQQ